MSIRAFLAFAALVVCSVPSLLAQEAQPPRTLRERLSPADEREGDIMRREAMRLAGQKGYRPGRYLTPHLAMFEAMGPSPVIPLTAGTAEPVQLKRNCTPGQRASVPNCIRIDALEFFTAMDSSTNKVMLSVVPHTFIGPNEAGMYEVGAHPDVQGDAEVIARRYSGRVVTAVPWPIPTRTPDGATPRNP